MTFETILSNPKYRFSIQIIILLILIVMVILIFSQFRKANRQGYNCMQNPFQFQADLLENKYNAALNCYCDIYGGERYTFGSHFTFNSTDFSMLRR